MSQKRQPRGFTLIELMIVVVIIGVLTSMGIPAFRKYQCRAKQSEAKAAMKQVFVIQSAYHAQNDTYITNAVQNTFLFPVLNGVFRYDIDVTLADANIFAVEAIGTPGKDMAGDTWIVNHVFGVWNVTDTFCE